MKTEGSPQSARVPRLAKSNIKAITQIEQEYLRQRSQVDRLSDMLSRFAGSFLFAIAHVVGFTIWILVNVGATPGVRPFDAYPFGLLSLMVGLEAILLSTFVLMSQNRQAHQADHWAHLDLQISLLAEQETTKILQMLSAVCTHLGLEKEIRDGELREMVGKKSVGQLAEKLAENLEKTRDQEKPLS